MTKIKKELKEILANELNIKEENLPRVMKAINDSDFNYCISDINTIIELIKQAELITMDEYTKNHSRSFKLIIADHYEYLVKKAYSEDEGNMEKLLGHVYRVIIHTSNFESIEKLKFY